MSWQGIMDTISALSPVLPTLISGAAILMLFWLGKHFASREETEALSRRLTDETEALASRVDAVEGRQLRMEERLKQLPTRRDIEELKIGMAELQGGQKATLEQVNGIMQLVKRQDNQTSLLIEHHLGRK